MTKTELLAVAKPILFNTEMVRAILDGRKTVTRRVVKPKYSNTHFEFRKDKYGIEFVEMQNEVEGETFGINSDGTGWRKLRGFIRPKPPYQKGDYLYVRETWNSISLHDVNDKFYIFKSTYNYNNKKEIKWHPSIHMPKEAARLFLRVTDVRAERLQDMNLDSFLSEGVGLRPEAFNDPDNAYSQARSQFSSVWDSIIKKADLDKYGWNANPWVWVIEFERVNIDG